VTPDGDPGLNYLCAGFKDFFHHVDRPMSIISRALKSGRPASEVMDIMRHEDAAFAAAVRSAGRNGPCPCGSGLKAKQCHGKPAGHEDADVPQPAGVGIPRPKVGKRASDD
jgi:uncharacterized protein